VSDAGAAAVLVALFPGDTPSSSPRVLLTVRSSRLTSHAGEVALPGGRCDPGDGPAGLPATAAAAAAREAREEVALPSSSITVLAHLRPVLSKHMLSVHVVVAAVREVDVQDLIPSPDEVAAIFAPPLAAFLDAHHHARTTAHWGPAPAAPPFYLHTFEHLSYPAPVWGLTAGVLIDVAATALGRPPPFPAHPPGVPYSAIVWFGGGPARVRGEGEEGGGEADAA
jgi:8-oxo-dGTP pyrophosphatase MutT (NUDIX family)